MIVPIIRIKINPTIVETPLRFTDKR